MWLSHWPGTQLLTRPGSLFALRTEAEWRFPPEREEAKFSLSARRLSTGGLSSWMGGPYCTLNGLRSLEGQPSTNGRESPLLIVSGAATSRLKLFPDAQKSLKIQPGGAQAIAAGNQDIGCQSGKSGGKTLSGEPV